MSKKKQNSMYSSDPQDLIFLIQLWLGNYSNTIKTIKNLIQGTPSKSKTFPTCFSKLNFLFRKTFKV